MMSALDKITNGVSVASSNSSAASPHLCKPLFHHPGSAQYVTVRPLLDTPVIQKKNQKSPENKTGYDRRKNLREPAIYPDLLIMKNNGITFSNADEFVANEMNARSNKAGGSMDRLLWRTAQLNRYASNITFKSV